MTKFIEYLKEKIDKDHEDEILERIDAVVQDSGDMSIDHIVSNVAISLSFKMTPEEKKFCTKEIKDVLGK